MDTGIRNNRKQKKEIDGKAAEMNRNLIDIFFLSCQIIPS
jgi:hypothetical protein